MDRRRVVLVDDHLVTREGARVLLELTGLVDVVGEAGSGADAIALCDQLRPDVVILDLRMPEMDGLAALEKIKADHPEVQALILTVEDDGATAVKAVNAGAAGYLVKSAPVEEYAAAIESLGSQGVYMSPSVTASVMAAAVARSRHDHDGDDGCREPTVREQEVLTLLGDGLTARSIARRLGISERTVNSHVGNLYRRIGVNNRVDAIRTAMRLGLLETPHP